MTTSSNHNMAEALARRLRNIMGDHNDENVGVETLVRRLVERQQPSNFESPEALATWLESLHECHDDGAVGSLKWEPAQVAARAVRSMGRPPAQAVGEVIQPAKSRNSPVGTSVRWYGRCPSVGTRLYIEAVSPRWAPSEWPRVWGTSRVADNAKCLLVSFEREPTNAELAAFDDAIKSAAPFAPQSESAAQQGGPLSSRLRPGVECAPWVIKEVHKLEAAALDTALLDWLEQHPRLAQVVVDGKATDCYLYGVSGAPGLKLREIIAVAMQQEKAHGH